MKPGTPNEQVTELLLQSLEHEKGGVQVYETALKCAVNEDLKEEWEKYAKTFDTMAAFELIDMSRFEDKDKSEDR